MLDQRVQSRPESLFGGIHTLGKIIILERVGVDRLIRVLANPIANVFQKQLTQRSAHPVFIIAIVHAALALICLPFVLTSSAFDVGAAVWNNMVIAALLAVSGNVLLVYALRQ